MRTSWGRVCAPTQWAIILVCFSRLVNASFLSVLSAAALLVKSLHDYACRGALKYANEYKNKGERCDFRSKAEQMTRVNRISKRKQKRSILCMFISSTRAHCRYCFCRQILKWIQGAFCAFCFKRSIFPVSYSLRCFTSFAHTLADFSFFSVLRLHCLVTQNKKKI